MSNAVMHKLQELVGKYTTLCPESDRQVRETSQQRVRQFIDLTEKQADATRNQGWMGLGSSVLGFGGTVIASMYFSNFAKPIGSVCSQVGNIFHSGYEAEKIRLGGRASLIQGNALPDLSKIIDKSHQFALGALSSLSRLQEQSGRSGIVH